MASVFRKDNGLDSTKPMPVDESVEVVDVLGEIDTDVTQGIGGVASTLDGPCLTISGNQLYYTGAAVNVLPCLGRISSTSPQTSWFLIVFINAVKKYPLPNHYIASCAPTPSPPTYESNRLPIRLSYPHPPSTTGR